MSYDVCMYTSETKPDKSRMKQLLEATEMKILRL